MNTPRFLLAATSATIVLNLLMPTPSLASSNGTFDVVEQAEFAAPVSLTGSHFGEAIAVSGATAIVGAPFYAPSGSGTPGAAFVFQRVGTSWIGNSAPIVAPGALALGARFGSSVAIDGDTIVIGAPRHPGNGQSSGSAYVLIRNGSSWSLEATLLPPPEGSPYWANRFGASVAIEGDLIAVGATGRGAPDGQTPGVGAAFLFERTGSNWELAAAVFAPDPVPGDELGCAVDLSGQRLVVGARLKERAGLTDAGAAFVWNRSAGSWKFEAELDPLDSKTKEGFGTSVTLSGDTAIVGAPGHLHTAQSPEGSARVFVRSGSVWTLQAELLPADPSAHASFGCAVGLSGERAVVGDRGQDLAGNWSGSITLFERQANSWGVGVEVVGATTMLYDNLGTAVAIDADTVVAGAPARTSWTGTAHAFVVAPEAKVGTQYCFGQACPCSNPDPGAGCANSLGQGASLVGSGSDLAAGDALCLISERLLPGQPALLFSAMGATGGGTGIPLLNGLLCASGGVVRLGARFPDGGGHASWGPGLGAQGGWKAGDTRYFQVWYRDPADACGGGANLTNGVAVTFQ